MYAGFVSGAGGNDVKASAVEYHPSGEGSVDFDDIENDGHESFVVLDNQNLQTFYYLRATLQTFDNGKYFDILGINFSQMGGSCVLLYVFSASTVGLN